MANDLVGVTYLKTEEDNTSYENKLITSINKKLKTIELLKEDILTILTNYQHPLTTNDLLHWLNCHSNVNFDDIELRDSLRELCREDKICIYTYDLKDECGIFNENTWEELFNFVWKQSQYSLFKNTDNTETDNNYSVLGDK